MKNLKNAFGKMNRFGLMALIVASAMAFSLNAPAKTPLANKVWAQTQSGEWELLGDRDHLCDQSQNTCVASYPENQDPNTNPSGGTVIEQNGFATILD